MNPSGTLEELYRPIEDALGEVRDTVNGLWSDALHLVRSATEEVPSVGGKMLRPALCLLSAGVIGGRDLRQYATLAASFEVLHIASLAHDDVVDRALLRRGASSLNARWDNHAAVLGGDYLVARAVEMMATYDSCPVVANAIRSVRRMAEGELHFFGREDEPVVKEDCLALAEQKTASLFAVACSAPAYLIDAAHLETLHGFGTALGIAFQIVDDLLDLTQPASRLGKPSCGDIVEGKRTLPILYLSEGLSPAEREQLAAMRGTDIGETDRLWVAAMVQRTGADDKTHAVSREFADRALRQLEALPKSPWRDSMAGILEFILVRAS